MALPQRLPTLTVREAATALEVHPSTIYRWVEGGTLPAVRNGRQPEKGSRRRGGDIRIPEQAVAEMLRRGPVIEAVEPVAS